MAAGNVEDRLQTMRRELERLQRDVVFFERELQREQNSNQRVVILEQIRNVKARILQVIQEERLLIEEENRNMERALEILQRRNQN
jgi:hypothetical protein